MHILIFPLKIKTTFFFMVPNTLSKFLKKKKLKLFFFILFNPLLRAFKKSLNPFKSSCSTHFPTLSIVTQEILQLHRKFVLFHFFLFRHIQPIRFSLKNSKLFLFYSINLLSYIFT